MKVTFGLDWDGTVTRAPKEFLDFTAALRAAGHAVYVVTMRYESEAGDIANHIHLFDGVVFTGRKAKEPACKELGINVDIWIEDTPKAIHHRGREIWGFETPEGFVDEHPVSESITIRAPVALAPTWFRADSKPRFEIPKDARQILMHMKDHSGKFFGTEEYRIHEQDVDRDFIARYTDHFGQGPNIPVRIDGKWVAVEIKTMCSLDILGRIHEIMSTEDFNDPARLVLNV